MASAFYNTNGLSQAVTRAITDGSNYYTIAYTPTNTKWNGSYRKIQIRLPQPNLTLTYRHGYFADDPDAHIKHSTSPDPTTLDSMRPHRHDARRARSHPNPLQGQRTPIAGQPAGETRPGNSADPTLKGPYRRYNVSYAANPRDVTFSLQPDGTYRASMQFLIFVYDQDGKLLNNIINIVNANSIPKPTPQRSAPACTFSNRSAFPSKASTSSASASTISPRDRVGAHRSPHHRRQKSPSATSPGGHLQRSRQ